MLVCGAGSSYPYVTHVGACRVRAVISISIGSQEDKLFIIKTRR